MKLLVGQKRFGVLARREMSITCRVQIGGRCEIASADRVRLPVHYIETQSFCVEVKVLAETRRQCCLTGASVTRRKPG